MDILFWTCIAIIIYSFVGYGIILTVLSSSRYFNTSPVLPSVTLVLPIYNEHSILADKIENSLRLNYPQSLFKIILVTDGSDGQTIAIAQNFALKYPLQITHFHEDFRSGKLHAIKRVMPFVDSEITIFSDCNSFLSRDALIELVNPFFDKNIGIVGGEKQVVDHTKSIQETEGLYWKIESRTKEKESNFDNIMGVAGELFALRTNLYPNLPADTILEDLSITLSVLKLNYKAVYAPKAIATEAPSPTIKDEYERKVRIAAGGYQCLLRNLSLLNPLKYPKISFQLFSHRILRYFFNPLCLPLLFISNVYLYQINWIYTTIFIFQIIFYSFALIGLISTLGGNKSIHSLFKIPFFFCMMHIALFQGFLKYLRRDLPTVWKKNRGD